MRRNLRADEKYQKKKISIIKKKFRSKKISNIKKQLSQKIKKMAMDIIYKYETKFDDDHIFIVQ